MIVKNADIAAYKLGQGVSRKILATGGAMMAVQFTFEKDAVGTPHSHPHEQVGYVFRTLSSSSTDNAVQVYL